MRNTNIRRLCLCGITAALYAALTLITAPLAFGPIQLRISEALVVLCALEPTMAIGLTLGCFAANLFSSVTALDMVVGTLATGLACLWTIRCRKPWMVLAPNILVNAVLVGGMLAWTLAPGQFWLMVLQIGTSQLIVMVVLGLPLYQFVRRSGFLLDIRTDP